MEESAGDWCVGAHARHLGPQGVRLVHEREWPSARAGASPVHPELNHGGPLASSAPDCDSPVSAQPLHYHLVHHLHLGCDLPAQPGRIDLGRQQDSSFHHQRHPQLLIAIIGLHAWSVFARRLCVHASMHSCVHAFMHSCVHAFMHSCSSGCAVPPAKRLSPEKGKGGGDHTEACAYVRACCFEPERMTRSPRRASVCTGRK
mmetsp:Transcript_13539/g.43194  ORF Transcript_13539/g.43194 Transcript_13539/m.43194 type:complete len:202 (-) Transcript_13539:67-672(-)